MTPAKVLIVEDDLALREALVTTLRAAGHDVLSAGDGTGALQILHSSPVDLVVTDVQMAPMDGHELLRRMSRELPGIPVLMMTAYGTVPQAVSAMREGAVDYLMKPFEASELESVVARYARCEPSAADDRDGPIALDPCSRALLDTAAKVAESDVTVLLRGESGTGKEVIARYIHAHSPRRRGPFVAINCAAIPNQMLEAILFGHEKGAFTGATTRSEGKFAQANGGTLLLDEISEMDLTLQAKLLRVLQEKEVEPLGAKHSIALDIRVLATTNRDLEDAVRNHEFREDLYYRLNVFPLRVPPLRERPGDIRALAEHFIRAVCRHKNEPRLAEATAELLQRQHWPGNVRQLRNVIERAMVLCGGSILQPEHLGLDPVPQGESADGNGLSDELWREEVRRILQALELAGGDRARTAQQLGISQRTLRYKLAKMRAAGVQVPRSARRAIGG